MWRQDKLPYIHGIACNSDLTGAIAIAWDIFEEQFQLLVHTEPTHEAVTVDDVAHLLYWL